MSTKDKNNKCDYNNYKKVRYFHGQLLSDRDFTEEQIYLNEKRKLHNRMLHGWGIVCGLEIEAIPDIEKIRIKKGLALDCAGNEIFVDKAVEENIANLIKQCEPAPVNTNPCVDNSDVNASTTWFVVLRYKDIPSDPVPVYAPGGGCEEKACDYSRVREGYCIELTQTCPNTQTIDAPCDGDLSDDEKKALLCEKLLYPCPSCCEEDGVVLGSIDVKNGTQIVGDSVNNWNCRKYVMTFGLLEHWMTKLGAENVPFDAIMKYGGLVEACGTEELAVETFEDICTPKVLAVLPNVVGQILADVRDILGKLGITELNIKYPLVGSTPTKKNSFKILEQTPKAYTIVYTDRTITLTVEVYLSEVTKEMVTNLAKKSICTLESFVDKNNDEIVNKVVGSATVDAISEAFKSVISKEVTMSKEIKTAKEKSNADTHITKINKKNSSKYVKPKSPVEDIVNLHQTIGNQAVQRLLESGGIQASLKIGQPNDIYEQEADRVADEVMRMPEDKIQRTPISKSITPLVQTKFDTQTLQVTPNIELKINALQGGGQPLLRETRNFFEPRFGQEFSGVRVHSDSNANQLARSVNAKAFTRGNDIVFSGGEYSPESSTGKRLLGHELTHVVQQDSASINNHMPIQRTDIRSPVFEETVTQVSTIEASVHGRPLGGRDIDLARSIFQNSIDYNRVRLIPTRLLEWRTVGNTIRVPRDFSIRNADMAQTFIHEMTHVWQYQHNGTSYISTSLADQVIGAIQTGSRNAAYVYQIVPGKSFFEYRVEQQAFIVEKYFSFLREQADPHITPRRRSLVQREISLHQPLIDQMRATLPRREVDILIIRASEVIQPSGLLRQEALPRERRLTPLKPLIEVRF
jgi:hypothetical protein